MIFLPNIAKKKPPGRFYAVVSELAVVGELFLKASTAVVTTVVR